MKLTRKNGLNYQLLVVRFLLKKKDQDDKGGGGMREVWGWLESWMIIMIKFDQR